MFLTRLLQKLLGYVNFKVDGGSGGPEKFLNLSVRAGVTMWNLRREGTALFGSTLLSNYKKLLFEAQKAGVRIYVTSKKGVPVMFARHRGRWGFIAGVVLFFAIIIYFSGFVWSVEIIGNKYVTSREIRYTLSDLGLSAGVRTDAFNSKNVEQKALMKLPDLSFMHINIDGSVAKVEVGERAQRPQIVPEDRPCNIKALTSGQIIDMQIYQGVTRYRKNDTIQKGELLVSGVVEEPKTKITRFLHARAKIIARTKHVFTMTVAYRTTEMRDTGKVIKRYRLNFLSLQIPFYFSEPHGSYRRMLYKSPLKIFGTELPVSISTTAFYEYRKTPVILTKQQAFIKAKTRLSRKVKIELSSAVIKKKTYTQKAGNNVFTLVGSYTCEENIAVEQEITMSDEIASGEK